jgi:copper oxidase (laccase) domain-containing protein
VDGSELPVEQFPALYSLGGVIHCFVRRIPGIDVAHDKAETLRPLDGVHREVRAEYGLAGKRFLTAQQVHGREIAVIDRAVERDECFAGCDGLITNQAGVTLGIYVADCCAVYLIDPARRAIGLVHSGKKGTELGIVGRAIEQMTTRFGSAPQDLIVQLSPCIRPPHYEIDFAADIVRACRERGVFQVHDSGVCTACHLDRYYSYRAEKGKTGRMLALLAIL